MRQSCDMFSSDADEDLDPAMEENFSFLSLSIGESKPSCPSDNSVGLDGFFTDEDEIFDDREEFLTTGKIQNPGHCAVGNVSDDVPADHATQHDVNAKANLEISIPDNVCDKNRPVKGSHSNACATGASVFSGYSSPAPCGSRVKSPSQPIDIVYANGSAESEWGHDRTKAASRRANRQLFYDAKAREDWREKAWERKRDQVLLEEFCPDDMRDRSKIIVGHQEFGEVVIDSPRTQKQALKGGPRGRNYLTNVDIDELKGCLDLGFGFNYEEMPELSHTLPALELCYAIGQNFQDHEHQKSSPVSTLDGADSAHCDSYAQSPIANWKISSPGDPPQEVKARLKVWAQAVACTVRLCS